MVDSLVCHLEHTTCQGVHPLQSFNSRAATRRFSLDSEHPLDAGKDETWTWQDASLATICSSSPQRSQQNTEVTAQV